MKLKYALNGTTCLTKCPFEQWFIGSQGCSKCEFCEAENNQLQYFNCKRACQMDLTLKQLKYKEINIDDLKEEFKRIKSTDYSRLSKTDIGMIRLKSLEKIIGNIIESL
jgi:hypothetical protein